MANGWDGWPDVPERAYMAALRELHPDFWNQRYIFGTNAPPLTSGIAGSARQGLTTGAKMELPTSAGMHWDTDAVPASERPQDRRVSGWIAAQTGDDRWVGPDGSTAGQPLEATAARDLYGGVSKRSIDGGAGVRYNLSMHSPNTLRLKTAVGKQLVQLGADVIEFDGSVKAGRLMRGDFSAWAIQDFQAWLAELPAARREELGIDDPESFDVQAYTQKLVGAVQAGDAPPSALVEDGVLFEFFLLEHRQLQQFFQAFTDHVKTAGEPFDAPVEVLANQGGSVVDTRGAASVLLSTVFDAIEIEGAITVPGQPERIDPYRTDIRTPRHKLTAARARATGKPPVEHGFYGTLDSERDLESGRPYPVLQTLNFAETYANGSRRQLDITGWADLPVDDISLFWWVPGEGIPDRLGKLADFLWTHKPALKGTPDSDIAVVYSLPTLVAKARRPLGRPLTAERNALYGFVRALREAQLPSEVVIFGHPLLWDDASALDRLPEYDVLVAPGCTALTDAQVDAVEAFLSAGGTVIHEGEFATHDGRYRPRESDPFGAYGNQLQATDGDARAVVPNGDPGPVIDHITEALDDRQVQLDATYPLSVEVTRTDTAQVVHLVNYDYDPGADAVASVGSVELSVREPEFDVSWAYTAAPSGEYRELAIKQAEGRLRVTVPGVDVWRIVVFDSEPAPAEQEPTERIETAAELVDRAAEEGRSLGQADAAAALREARLAADTDQPARARRRADRAMTAAREAVTVPRVGIDTGHGQGDRHSFAALEDFRGAMQEELALEFVEVTEFSTAQLRGLDGLVIGQPVAEGATFDLPDDERAAVTEFVENGGGVALFAQPAAEPVADLDALASEFGFAIDFRPLRREGAPDDYFVPVSVPSFRTPLTYQFVPQEVNLAGSVTINEEAVERAVTTGPAVYRDGAPETTDRWPVLVGARYGTGRVACSTNSRMLTTPRYGRRVLDRNILHWITGAGESGTAASPTLTSTTTPASSQATSATSETPSRSTSPAPTETDAPGFGALAALGGLGGVLGYALASREESDEG